MELDLFWTKFSQKELKRIYDYYRGKAGSQVARKIVTEVYNETLILKKQPRIGRVEELLTDREQEFRYLIHKNHKIIYWINDKENRIEINDVFDARQNPIKINRRK